MLKSPLAFAHQILKESVLKGDTVIDATVGNGHDTVLLASLVDTTGKVYGFDIQKEGIATTKQKLILTRLLEQTELIHDGHENIEKYITEPEEITAAVFNLGYLPKGDKKIITKPDSTISALKQTMNILKKGGIITVMVYYGHDGGLEEKNEVHNFVRSLPQNAYNVLEYKYINQVNNPPYLYVIEKK